MEFCYVICSLYLHVNVVNIGQNIKSGMFGSYWGICEEWFCENIIIWEWAFSDNIKNVSFHNYIKLFWRDDSASDTYHNRPVKCTATLACEFLRNENVPLVLPFKEDKLSNIVDEFFDFHFSYHMFEVASFKGGQLRM